MIIQNLLHATRCKHKNQKDLHFPSSFFKFKSIHHVHVVWTSGLELGLMLKEKQWLSVHARSMHNITEISG